MSNNQKTAERTEAFKLFSSGKTQKEIGQLLGITEKTIGKWKVRYKWLERLKKAGVEKGHPAFLVLPELNEEAILNNPGGLKILQNAVASINQNLIIIHQVLTDHNLIK